MATTYRAKCKGKKYTFRCIPFNPSKTAITVVAKDKLEIFHSTTFWLERINPKRFMTKLLENGAITDDDKQAHSVYSVNLVKTEDIIIEASRTIEYSALYKFLFRDKDSVRQARIVNVDDEDVIQINTSLK